MKISTLELVKEACISTDIEAKFQLDTAHIKITIPIYLSHARRKSLELLQHLLDTRILDTEECFGAIEGLQIINLTQ